MTSQYQWSLRDSASAMDLCFRELRDALRTFSAIEQLLRDADDDEAMTTPLCRGDLYQLMIALNDNLQAKVHGIEKHWTECQSKLTSVASEGVDSAARPISEGLTVDDIVALISTAAGERAPYTERDLRERFDHLVNSHPDIDEVRMRWERAISARDGRPREESKSPARSKLAA
jgi:hypothetical protein